ncbi:MAG: transcriptional regulator [Campylobacterales bacterium]
MTQRDMAGILGVDVKTLRNWRKERPELYRKVMQGFKLEAAVEEARRHYEAMKEIAQDGLEEEKR